MTVEQWTRVSPFVSTIRSTWPGRREKIGKIAIGRVMCAVDAKESTMRPLGVSVAAIARAVRGIDEAGSVMVYGMLKTPKIR